MPDHAIMNYVETTAPAELTLVEWRRSNATQRRRRFRLRVLLPLRPAFAF